MNETTIEDWRAMLRQTTDAMAERYARPIAEQIKALAERRRRERGG